MTKTALAFAFLAASASPALADCAHWTATSTTSISITGDITTCKGSIAFGNGKSLKLDFVGQKNGSWALGAADHALIYRVRTPSDPVLLNGNTLCGEKVHYLAFSPTRSGQLGLTVFGRDLGDFCAVFFYEAR